MTIPTNPAVRVMAEYETFPTWLVDEQGTQNLPPGKLGLSQDLSDELLRWSDTFDSTYNADDPLSSGFAAPEEEQAFNAQGWALARRVAAEVGSRYRVRYFDLTRNEEFAVPASPHEG